MKIDNYHNSSTKKVFDFTLSLLGFIFFLPLIFIFSMIIKLTSKGPVFFKQKRVGKNGKVFTIVKFRTMKVGAEKLQKKLRHLNETDGPVFKIYNDPRFTRIGKFLSRTGLDELPQLINVIKGDMSLVGPRPLPVNEANKITSDQKIRQLIKPGITSLWVINGTHKLRFKQWMNLDKKYVSKASLGIDISILLKTFFIIIT